MQLVQLTMVLDQLCKEVTGLLQRAGRAKSGQFGTLRAFDYEGIARKACARRPRLGLDGVRSMRRFEPLARQSIEQSGHVGPGRELLFATSQHSIHNSYW
jgi:hypothetical protein